MIIFNNVQVIKYPTVLINSSNLIRTVGYSVITNSTVLFKHSD